MVAELPTIQIPYKPKPPPRQPGKLNRGSKTTKIRQALDLQDEMKSIATDASEKALARTAAARVWKEIGLFVLSLRGVGLPAPVKSEPKRGKRSGGALRPAVVQQPEPAIEQPSTEPIPPAA